MSTAFHVEIERSRDGAYHMRRDEELVELVRQRNEPAVRLYSWQPYAVSLGFNQDASVIDTARCAEMGIDVVRRPTGGRAVLHAEEITYAVVTPLGGRSSHDWYAEIHRTIAAGLSELGLGNAAFVKSQPKFAEEYARSSGALCFSTSARYELEWSGKKFVGSAQRVIGDVLLQHGSILLGRFHERLPDVLTMDDAKRESMRTLLRSRAISIGEILSREVRFEDCCPALNNAFSEMFAKVDHSLLPQTA